MHGVLQRHVATELAEVLEIALFHARGKESIEPLRRSQEWPSNDATASGRDSIDLDQGDPLLAMTGGGIQILSARRPESTQVAAV
jgi:hypothetical protein